MMAYQQMLGLLACCFVVTVVAAPNRAQQNCLSGVPCGSLCAPLGGTCIDSQCYDSLGYPALCYAPMANPYDTNSWWQPLFAPIAPMFKPFQPFQPFMAPMQPMQPMQPMGDMFAGFNDCGGNGPCASGMFCDPTGVCREDTCQNQFKFGCPKDTGDLTKVNCIHNSGFTTCYESSTGGFKCYKGRAGGTVACASNGFSSTSATMTSNFDINDNTNNMGDQQQQQQQGGTASATSSSSSSGSGSGSTTASGTVGSTGGAATTQNPAGTTAQNPNTQTPETQNPAAAAAAPEANSTAAAAPTVSTAAVAGTAQQQQQARRQRRQKAKAAAAAAAATGDETPGTPAKATFLKGGAPNTQQVAVSPNGQSVTVTDVANDRSAAAVGSATGAQKFVATNVVPGGSSVESAAVSGPDGGPAVANSVAAAGTPSAPGH